MKKRGENRFFHYKTYILVFLKIHVLDQKTILLENGDCQVFAGI